MGNHKQALQIYVFQIRDYTKAENYCNKIYLQQSSSVSGTSNLASPSLSTTTSPLASPPAFGTLNRRLGLPLMPTNEKLTFSLYDIDDAQPNIYTVLLSLYLRPPPPHNKGELLWAPALDLLSKHGARLPASSTLDLMPNDLLIRELENYFRGRIRNANTVRNEERIVKGLEGARKVELERQLLLGKDGAGSIALSGKKGPSGGVGGGRSRRVVIREEDHCRVCHKRFGNSAIRVYPDNEVIHYGCIGRSGAKRMGGGGGGDFDGMKRIPWG